MRITRTTTTGTHARLRSTTDSRSSRPSARRYSVLNDFRYLTSDDAALLAAATGEHPDEAEPTSQFAQQLALDRRRGDLAREAPVTAQYLRDASTRIAKENEGRTGFRNPYSGASFQKALTYLARIGRDR